MLHHRLDFAKRMVVKITGAFINLFAQFQKRIGFLPFAWILLFDFLGAEKDAIFVFSGMKCDIDGIPARGASSNPSHFLLGIPE